MSKGKKYRDALGKVDRMRLYPPRDALELVRETSYASFDSTVDVHFRLSVDPRRSDQQVRAVVLLPHGLGKVVKVLVFAAGDAERIARDAGADYVASDDEWVKKIQGGWTDFDVAIATPDMMSVVGRLGRVLGPRGLMPNPKTGTVTPDTAKAVEDAKGGKVDFRVDRAGNIHAPLGLISFGPEKLAENARTFFEAIMRARPTTVKGPYVRSVSVSGTMTPSVRIDKNEVRETER